MVTIPKQTSNVIRSTTQHTTQVIVYLCIWNHNYSFGNDEFFWYEIFEENVRLLQCAYHNLVANYICILIWFNFSWKIFWKRCYCYQAGRKSCCNSSSRWAPIQDLVIKEILNLQNIVRNGGCSIKPINSAWMEILRLF